MSAPTHTQPDPIFEYLEIAPHPALLVSHSGDVIATNSLAEELFGYAKAELLSMSVEQLMPERFREGHRHLRASYSQEPTTRAMGAGRDLTGLHRDGRELPLEIALNPISIEDQSSILLSVVDISERIEQSRRLRESLVQKEILLKETHHRVKNNLSVIRSMLFLQVNASSQPELTRILEHCAYRIDAMARVHETLYRSVNLESIDFGSYLEGLAKDLQQAHSPGDASIALQCELEPLEMRLEQAIPAGMIMTELITNAFEHAFHGRSSGVVTVSAHARSKIQYLRVRDDGAGISPALLEGSEATLGLRLVHLLARQIDARIHARSTAQGSDIQLQIGDATHAR
jgi:PAS domain S-box-containing protein